MKSRTLTHAAESHEADIMTGNIKWLFAAALAAILLPAAAQAQYPCGGYGFGGWGQPNYGQGIYQGTSRIPPYFALHPPVYYSHEIVRRPMGMSPFAYPSWYMPPRRMMAESTVTQPMLVVNPYVKGNGDAPAQASGETANPYVVTSE